MEHTLVLNSSYEPLKVVTWQRAMTLWAQNKAEIVAEYDKEVRSVTFSFKLPSVVRLLRFVKSRTSRSHVPFTRFNIYQRDHYTCQYCGQQLKAEELTFDHVIPASQGGTRTWTNIATACYPCNRRKGARTPEEAGMRLLRLPRKPEPSPVFRVTFGLKKTPDSWKDWLASNFYWNVEIDEDGE
jgi:5-methylcytosine-specific restriction endonuclease McrA